VLSCALTRGNSLIPIRRSFKKRGYLPCVLVAALICSISSPGAPSKHRSPYRQSVAFGPQNVELDGICFVLVGSMSAGDFFTGLRRIDTPNGVEFRKGSSMMERFPSEISVRIAADGIACPDKPGGENMPVPSADLANSMRFEASWKRGMQLRPVETLSVKGPAIEKGWIPWAEPYPMWIYELKVVSKDVPLTDHLVISLYSKDHKRLARLSARM
jgi:hypothetical protein